MGFGSTSTCTDFEMELEEVARRLGNYWWYHRIAIADGLYTPSTVAQFQPMWNFNLHAMNAVDFNGRKVLDVGCRDGLFSFEAERRGAREVIGIDTRLSLGTTELLIPYFRSNVKMYELSLFDIEPDRFGTFDIILCYGVLYHLRYPVWGLQKLVNCLADGGTLLVESGMLVDSRYAASEFMYCPVEDSPYEPSSCSFFNRKALDTTMRSLGCEAIACHTLGVDFVGGPGARALEFARSTARRLRARGRPRVKRQFLIYRKNSAILEPRVKAYWDGHPIGSVPHRFSSR
jgi:SAM-dependent methyltransferase